jgi:hypothetical protein|tara:strand:+ start:413 stop:625 length:213 start_codon:yes stop_codon:yes gene_type:complete
MKIDKDIPIQKARSETRKDIEKMEVGDSIWVNTKKDSERYRHAMIRLGWSVTVRMTEEPSPNGYRIWRTK